MKKLTIVVAALFALGCSKETDIITMQVEDGRTMLNGVNQFKVGELNGGTPVITYDQTELEEICACAVSEDFASNLLITFEHSDYYLRGVGTGSNSSSTFAVKLTVDGLDLYWTDGAFIAQCESDGSTTCGLDLLGGENYNCTGSAQCSEHTLGGVSGDPYPSCTNWPWAGFPKDEEPPKKED
ncbi:MAG: hypothetical protein Kow0075_16370 [Salibacteraceae bacterium]